MQECTPFHCIHICSFRSFSISHKTVMLSCALQSRSSPMKRNIDLNFTQQIDYSVLCASAVGDSFSWSPIERTWNINTEYNADALGLDHFPMYVIYLFLFFSSAAQLHDCWSCLFSGEAKAETAACHPATMSQLVPLMFLNYDFFFLVVLSSRIMELWNDSF